MDDLLLEFLTETNESLDVVDVELVRFEQDPNDAQILDNIFRLVHTIKGTCGFLGLPRLESLAHAAESLMGKYRSGSDVTENGVSVILQSIDRLKEILALLEESGGEEPEGDDKDLIEVLDAISSGKEDGATEEKAEVAPEPEAPVQEQREIKAGEVSLEELERAFNETAVEIDGFDQPAAAEAEPVVEAEAEAEVEVKPVAAVKKVEKKKPAAADADPSKQSISSQSIRVNVETLEDLMTMVSELVLTRNQLLEIVRRHEDSEFKVPLQRLSNVTGELQEGVMKTRMQPIGNAWQKLPRIVRDLGGELGKEIDLIMIGADTELDRQVLDMIKDPLTHMVRNSADHGLEMPEDRRSAGKPEKGKITLSAYHEGGHIIIEIVDDGKGLNTERISEKIIANGLASESEVSAMSEAQIHKYIFAAGFSTAAKVTSVSGRGVGMDVVRNNIEVIGGTVDVKSVEGVGSTFMIKIPLTLAIVSALIVESSGDRFAIPQLSVLELVQAETNTEYRIERIKDTAVLRLRNKLLPLINLSKMLGISNDKVNEDADEASTEESGFIVVMQVGSQNFGVVVDSVFHTEEIVVKPMSSALRNVNIFSGNTILGDGAVIMIVDPNGISQKIVTGVVDQLDQISEEESAQNTVNDALTSMLVFRGGSNDPKAVPLSLVTRLEEIDVDKIEHSNGSYVVQYRGSLMPLVYLNDEVERRTEGAQPMLVFSDAGRSMGLVVDEIVDIVDEVLDIEVDSELPGVIGSAVIKGKATEIMDVSPFLLDAFDDWFEVKDDVKAAATRSLLYVDQSEFFRNMLGPVLRTAKYNVSFATTAEEAMQLIQEGNAYDVIMLDADLPGLGAFGFAKEVQNKPAFKKPELIAMSTVCTPLLVERCREADFADFVAKFDRPGLVSALKELTVEMDVAA